MSEDWVEVARAINARMTELGVSQRELIARSQVSKAIVREIQHNTVQRRRSERTLEALSLALDWHAAHLLDVLTGKRPQRPGEPVLKSSEDVPGRLALIEFRLREITDRLDEMRAIGDRLDEINTNVETVIESVRPQAKRPAD